MDWLAYFQTIIHRTISDGLGDFVMHRDGVKLAAILPLGIFFGAIHDLTLCFSVGLAIAMVTVGAVATLRFQHASKRWSGFGDPAERAP